MNSYTFHINLYDIAFLAAIFIGLTFALLLWFTQTTNRSANRFLTLALAVMVLWMIRTFAVDIKLGTYLPHWDWLPLQLLLALGPFMYFYVLKITHPQYKFSWRDLLHLSPLILEQAILTFEINESATTGAAVYSTHVFQQLNPILQLLIFISNITYLYFCNKLIQHFYRQLQPVLMDRPLIEFRWLRRLLVATALLWILWIVCAAVDYFGYRYQLGVDGYYPFYIFFVVIIIWTAAAAFLKPQAAQIAQTAVPPKPSMVPAELKAKGTLLKRAMETQLYYQDPELSLNSLAEKLSMPPHELSRVINTVFKKGFNDFINEFRVVDVVSKMRNPAYGNITLLGIAFDAGFNSKATFIRAFKQLTGKNPAEYKNSLEKEVANYHLQPHPQATQVILSHQATKRPPEKLKYHFMFRNYLKIAWRNISRKKLYTAINLAGLGMASAVCILIYWYVQYEQSFDRFHPNVSQLYRFEFSNYTGQPKEKPKEGFFSFLTKKSSGDNMIITPVILAGELKKNFPEIQHAVRIGLSYETTVRVNNQSFKEERAAAYVDTDFLQVFYYPLLQGNPANVLTGHNHVVLTEKLATKYFGSTDAVGKTIMFTDMDSTLYTVSGVMKNFPVTSSFQFDILIPRESVPGYNYDVSNGLNTSKDLLVLQLNKSTNEATFAQKLDAWGQKYFADARKDIVNGETKADNFHIVLRPFADAHYNVSGGWGHYTDVKNIFQLSCLVVVILLIACLNYILLTLTGTVSRSQEVGIRKTFGAPRTQIVLQFYIETQLLIFIAVAIGFLLAIICMPVFNGLVGAHLQLGLFSIKHVIVMLGLMALLLGALAGVYPSLVMSGLRAINMMRMFSAYKLSPVLSKILVITQFSVCIILIISSLVVGKQMRYMNTASLGYDKDQILSIENPFAYNDFKSSYLLKSRLYNYVASEPSLEGVTSSTFPFGGYGNINNHIINGERHMLEVFDIDYNYFSFFKIPIVKGRDFSPTIPSDSTRLQLTDDQREKDGSAAREPVVVNETLYKMLRSPALNVHNREMGGTIIGVCKDYHSDDLTRKIEPVYHRIMHTYIPYFSVKIKAGQNIPQVMDKLKANWAKLTGGEAFAYNFLDEKVAKSYDAYLRWMKTIFVSCFLAILIACMGLFGLSGLTAVSRIKEIGIRKVLGASVNQLFVLLNTSTCVMALISFVVAVPLAIILANQWLENFAYRIKLDWSVFAIAGVISIATALLAVSYHTIKTARSNPVKSLRTE